MPNDFFQQLASPTAAGRPDDLSEAPDTSEAWKNEVEVEGPTDEQVDLIVRRKQERFDLLQAKKKWLQEHRIYFFNPMCRLCKGEVCTDPAHKNPNDSPQYSILHSPAHTRLAVGTNRSGKTTVGVLDDIARAIGFRPWELPDDLKQCSIEDLMGADNWKVPDSCRTPIKTPAKILIIVEDWDVADDILLTGTLERAGKLKFYTPPGAIASWEKNSLGYFFQVIFKNGSVIRIDTEKSFINNPKSFEGASYDQIHYDEPKRRDLRVALARGLVDTKGYELFTFTPLTEPWVKSEIYDKAGLDPEIHSFFLHAKDNSHISQEGWEQFLSKLDEDEKAARGEGQWVHLRGLIYPQFISKLHKPQVRDASGQLIYPGGHLLDPLPFEWVHQNGTAYVQIDPHSRQPLTAEIMIADRQGRLIVWEELFVKTQGSGGVLIPEFCDLLWMKLRKLVPNPEKPGEDLLLEIPVAAWRIDNIAFEPDPVDGTCWANSFLQAGMPVQPASKSKQQGILAVRKALREQKLLFCSNCTTHISEIQHYLYDDWGKTSKPRNEKEVPQDKDDHTMECLYRNVLLRPQYINIETENEPIEPVKGWCS